MTDIPLGDITVHHARRDTFYLKEIDESRSPSEPTTAIARHYGKLPTARPCRTWLRWSGPTTRITALSVTALPANWQARHRRSRLRPIPNMPTTSGWRPDHG